MTTLEKQRAECGRLMDVLVSHKRKVHYAQIRPMQTNTIKPHRLWIALSKPSGVTMDCSESFTLICRLAGLRDPNGLHYDGSGFTGTIGAYLDYHYLEPHRAEIGAGVLFGEPPYKHICMVRKPGDNPLLFSHGCELDPSFYDFETMKAAFPGDPYTFVSISKLSFGGQVK